MKDKSIVVDYILLQFQQVWNVPVLHVRETSETVALKLLDGNFNRAAATVALDLFLLMTMGVIIMNQLSLRFAFVLPYVYCGACYEGAS